MRTFLKWAGRAGFALAIAGAVMAGGPRTATALDCPDPKPDPYTCPPLTEQDCWNACFGLGFEGGGHCFGPGCCTCAA